MRRRNLILGTAASGIGGITLLGTGAFDTATAERTATVNFADDEDSYLGLVPESEYAIDDDGELALDFTGTDTDGDGIGRNSEYFFDLVFSIANQATNPVSITITTDTGSFDGEFTLYPTGDRDEELNDGSNAIELDVGESQSIGTQIQTGDVDVSNDVDIDVEIAAEFDDDDDDSPEEPDPAPDPEPVEELEFFSTSSLLNADSEPLDDDDVVAVRAESTAFNEDNEGEFVDYPDDVDIPLAAVDDGVVAFGSELGPDESEEDDNRAFIVNTWTGVLGNAGTVKFDETHGQELSLANDFSQLSAEAEDREFEVEAIESDFVDGLSDADAVMVATDDDDVADFGGFSDDERSALSDFVDDGGAVFLHGTADFEGTSNDELNEVLSDLDAPFRFNVDQVNDEENNGFAPFVPRTSNFNTDEFGELFGEVDE